MKYSEMTRDELYKLASEKVIPNRSKMDASELIEALEADDRENSGNEVENYTKNGDLFNEDEENNELVDEPDNNSNEGMIVKKSSETEAGKLRAKLNSTKISWSTIVARKKIFVGRDKKGKGIWANVGDHFRCEGKRAKYLVGLGDAMTPEQEAAGMSVEKGKTAGKYAFDPEKVQAAIDAGDIAVKDGKIIRL